MKFTGFRACGKIHRTSDSSLKSTVILQARTNSSRLPGKVLLPINGFPLVILAAKRAANTGREVIIATSSESSDDALAELVTNYGITCVRGSLDNTLQRFVTALEDYDSDALVFRLTADNVLPDGALLDEIEKDFVERGLDYLCCNGEASGLPYGMSAELMRVKHLHEAVSSTPSLYDQEHVTPYIRRRYGEAYFERYKSLGKGHYRCTVDCIDDYLSLQKVFAGVDDPIRVSALDLIDRLDLTPYHPLQTTLATKLILGTAQLGLNYGIANQTGKPDQAKVEKLIKTAIVNGVSYIDTARAYGESEEMIGNALKSGWVGRAQIITKLSPLVTCPIDATPTVVNAFVDASIYRSCAELCVQTLDAVLLHRASHLWDWEGAVWSRLLEHKTNGLLKLLGASVQSPTELKIALECREVCLIQLPFNVLDWRWDELIPEIRAQQAQRGLLIHVRSALLQGLLGSQDLAHWYSANVEHPDTVIAWLADQSNSSGSESIAEFCLRYVKSLDWVDGVVVGMETQNQLTENVRTFTQPAFSQQTIEQITMSRLRLEEGTLNPVRWSKTV